MKPNIMKLNDKYLETLESFDDYVTVLQWAQKVAEIYPDILENAEQQAKGQKNPTTGLREIAARIGSKLSTNGFNNVTIDLSEKPRKVKYISEIELTKNKEQAIEDDIAPLTRGEKIKNAEQSLTDNNIYRIREIEDIQSRFKQFLNIDFEIDHAKALLNKEVAGKHHPDNLQLLLKYHNSKKNNNNWDRFSFKEQKNYILKTIELQNLINAHIKIKVDENIVNSLLARLQKIY